MKTLLIDLIAGARPNFMKIAPIIEALDAPRAEGLPLQYRLIHTGQHYDQKMSGDFFEQLGIPNPHHNLEVGSGSQAEQTAAIMVRYEKIQLTKRSDLCLVVGDVTSTMACAITAQKLGIPVAHVEGGIRSGDWTMPEEINRMVTDSVTNWFFTTSEYANTNLRKMGVSDNRIFFVGNTMIDTLLKQMPNFRPPAIWTEADLQPGGYFVLTLHRPANVDNSYKLAALLSAIESSTRCLPVIFPVHPRTRQALSKAALQRKPYDIRSPTFPSPAKSQVPGTKDDLPPAHFPLILVDPLGYLEFNYLVQHAKAVITDSGGITEEATVMGVPCMTLRDSTERPETVIIGTNELLGTDPASLKPVLDRLFALQWKSGRIPPLWDGHAATRIVGELDRLLKE